MKNTKLFLFSVVATALLFSTLNAEAKSNYSNKVSLEEDRLKANTTTSFMPSLSIDEAPVFSTQMIHATIEKYSPEQLNHLIGVWPARVEAENKVNHLHVALPESTVNNYTPEQFVKILELTF